MKIRVYIEAARITFRLIRKLGLDEGLARAEQIGKQSDFWLKEVQRNFELTQRAFESGNIEAFNKARGMYEAAWQRFHNEVEKPLEDLARK